MGCGASSAQDKYEFLKENEKKKKPQEESKEAAAEEEKLREAEARRKNSITAIIRVGQRLVDHYQVEKPGLAFASSQTAGRKPRAVSRIVLKRTGEVRACRTVRRRRVDAYSATKEIEALVKLDHPNIVKIFEVFQDEVNTYMVIQWCEGEKLLKRIHEEGALLESSVAYLVQQLLGAVSHMHSSLVCHRNLDLNHICLLEKGPLDKCTLKVCDFELAALLSSEGEKIMESIVPYGNYSFMAPEVLSIKPYHVNVDIWSIGIATYLLLCGSMPFRGDNAQAVHKAIIAYSKARAKEEPTLELPDASAAAAEFVMTLLNPDAASRCSADGALHLSWLKNAEKARKPLTQRAVQGILSYGHKTILEKKCMQIIATNLPDEEIKDLVKMFQTLDSNGDGEVSLTELKEAVDMASKRGKKKHKTEVTEHDILKLMESMDSNGNQRISYTEFLAACLEERHYSQEAAFWHAFRYFDRNNDGCISKQELFGALQDDEFGPLLPAHVVRDLMKHADADGNQQIDYYEFMAMVQPHKDGEWHQYHAVNGAGPPKLPPSPSANRRKNSKETLQMCPKCQQVRQIKDRGDKKGLMCAACWMNEM